MAGDFIVLEQRYVIYEMHTIRSEIDSWDLDHVV